MWYGCDFGTCDGEILSLLAVFVETSNPNLAKLLKDAAKQDYKITFHDYDWSLNSMDP